MEPNLQQLGNQATQAIEQQYPSIQLLRDALEKKVLSTENPLIKQRDVALANFLASPDEARQKFSQPMNVTIGGGQAVAPGQNPVGEQVTVPNVYRSPLEQRAQYSRYVANKFAPLSTLNDLLMLQGGGVEGILSQANEAIKSDVEAKKNKFSNALSLAQLNLQQQQEGKGQLTQIIDENGNPRTVLINPYTGEFIKDVGASAGGVTAKDMLNKRLGKGLVAGINSIDEKIRNQTGSPTALTVLAKLNSPLGLGKLFLQEGDERKLAELESQYFALVQNAVATIQGTRPSDYDVKSYQKNLGPSIQNPPGVNEDRVKNLLNLTGIQSISTSQGGIRAEEVRARLEATGKYTPQEIEAYLKKKGLL